MWWKICKGLSALVIVAAAFLIFIRVWPWNAGGDRRANPQPETPAPRQTEQPDIKPAHESEYLRLFIHESPVCARLGKTIYLRKEFHERIQRIVQTIGGNRVSLFSYVDNVLEKHFADWQGDIEREYKQRNTGIF